MKAFTTAALAIAAFALSACAPSSKLSTSSELALNNEVLAPKSVERSPEVFRSAMSKLWRTAANESAEESSQARKTLDRLGGAKGAWRSGLYWHHDRDAAIKAAKESGKVVMSLRVLGSFDEEFC